MKALTKKAKKDRAAVGFKAAALRWAEQMRLASIRPKGKPQHDIGEIARDVLATDGRVSIEELQRRLISVYHVKPAQAVAEVDTFAGDSMKTIRHRTFPLVYPVTEWGFDHPDIDPEDAVAIRRAVPWGTGKRTFGWVLAKNPGDPVYLAFQKHAIASSNGIREQVTASTTAAVEAGVMRQSVALLPEVIEG